MISKIVKFKHFRHATLEKNRKHKLGVSKEKKALGREAFDLDGHAPEPWDRCRFWIEEEGEGAELRIISESWDRNEREKIGRFFHTHTQRGKRVFQP